jgi:hypothetical protein
MMTLKFIPEIELGQILQALVLIATIGGGVLGGYLTLRADIEDQRTEFRIAIAAHDARLSVLERALEERRREDREFEAETRAALERIAQAIADLKTEIVQKQDRR